MTRAPRTRVGLIVAVGVLLLDGILLITAGIWNDRTGLVVGGLASILVAAVLMVLWRGYLKRLGELDEARADMRREVEQLGRLTKKKQ